MSHPDEQIVAEHRARMNRLAGALDDIFNGDKTGPDRPTCFVLLVAPFGTTDGHGRVNYISNGERSDIVTMMKEVVARFEGQPEQQGGHA